MANIPIEQLEQMFRGMSEQSRWDTSQDMLWGYFFMDPKKEKLEPLAEHLAKSGYRFMSIYKSDNGRTYVLHVERVETHTPISLFDRNTELSALASKFDVDSYDGMDVGPIEPKQ